VVLMTVNVEILRPIVMCIGTSVMKEPAASILVAEDWTSCSENIRTRFE
jgi:hypothetical protein